MWQNTRRSCLEIHLLVFIFSFDGICRTLILKWNIYDGILTLSGKVPNININIKQIKHNIRGRQVVFSRQKIIYITPLTPISTKNSRTIKPKNLEPSPRPSIWVAHLTSQQTWSSWNAQTIIDWQLYMLITKQIYQ